MASTPTNEAIGDQAEVRRTASESERRIISKLVYDEQDFLKRLEEVVERALRWFRLEPGTGRVVLNEESKRLRVRDQIRLLAAGRHFAKRLGLALEDKLTYREIAEELNRPPSGVSPELTVLVRDGDLVRDADGRVSMPFHRIEGVLSELERTGHRSSTDSDSASERPRRASTRIPRRSDPVLQSLLERPADLSNYAWIRTLKTAREKGLAALLIARDVYGVDELTCQQMAILLTRKFPVSVTRAAINMGFLEIKSRFVAPVARGNEVAYSLLPLGRDYIQKAANDGQTARSDGNTDV